MLRGAFAVLRVEEDKWREKLSNLDENKVDLDGQAQLHRGPFGEKDEKSIPWPHASVFS